MPAPTTLRPFFSYYGGKWRIAKKLYPEPKHDVLVEPFAGSAGYALRYPERQVILCEKDPCVAAVWRYLIHEATIERILELPDVDAGTNISKLRVSQPERYLIGFWLNRAGVRPKTSTSAWMRPGLRPGSFWGQRVKETIASQLSAIRHWQIFCCDYRKCPYDGKATWFVDPPYQIKGRHYRFGSPSIDFQKLRSWCLTRRGQTIVCEQAGSEWLRFVPIQKCKTTRKSKRSHEAVWINELP